MRSKRKREPIEVEISNLSHEGRGVGRVNGKTIFVSGALPDELALARKTRGRKSFDEGIALEITNPNPSRVEPGCEDYGICGGCSLQHFDPEQQIKHKQSVLLELLIHHASCKPENVLPPMTGPKWHYRRRARLGVKYVEKKGGTLVGFREKASPYIADIKRCEVLDKRIGHRLQDLRQLVDQFSIRERVPQVEVAMGDSTCALIVRHLEPFNASDIDLLEKFQTSTGISFYLQPAGEDSIHPLNDATEGLSYQIDDLTFNFAPNNFVQVNQSINVQMVAKVAALLQLSEDDRVLDLFCGLGNFTLPMAKLVEQVHGIEGSEALVSLADENTRLNTISNATFEVGDLFDETALSKIDFRRFNKMLLDPPRTGAQEILENCDLAPIERLAYVSCNPVTFARDVNTLLQRHNFKMTDVGVMDMFPHTAHVECMGIFTR